jgi:hypothetical protein
VSAKLYHVALAALPGAAAVESTASFAMLGLSWARDPGVSNVQANVRVHSHGVWTDWSALSKSDSGADGGSPDDANGVPRDGTEPLWVGSADGVQASFVSSTGRTPRDLRIDLVDPGTSRADATFSHSPSVSSAAVAHADAVQPQIFTRADWGADESLRLGACPSGPENAGAIKVAFVHHTVTGNGYTPADVPAIIRSIYAFHVQSEGWCDVGYNFLVDQFGRVFEGRYGGIDQAVLGAHTGGFNTGSFGVAMIGTFDTVTPPQAMTDALSRLLAWKLSLAYLNPESQETLTSAAFDQNRFAPGTAVRFNVISGHRDADLTACPGNAGYAVLPFVRQAVFATMTAGFADPKAQVSPRALSSNGSVHVTAGELQAGDWQLNVTDASGNIVQSQGGTGSSVDATWDMTANGSPVPVGLYTLTLTGQQAGVDARAWTTTVQVGGVFGGVDAVTAPAIGALDVKGWALHGSDDAPVNVRVTVSGSTVGTLPADLSRPDVAAAHAGYGAGHGFDQTFAAAPGFHTVCGYGINDEVGGPDALLGCIGVTVPGAPPVLTGRAADPVGLLDRVQAGPTQVRLIGWTLDPETIAPISIAVYVDATFMGYYVAASGRPDVAAAHPGYGLAHGFDQIVGGVVPGSHRVCAYAINVGNGTTNPTLGCAVVSVPTGNPTGHVDAVLPVPGGVVAWGWATDPDAAHAIAVHIYVDGHFASALTANQLRPDVGAAFPLYGNAHGFAVALTLGTGTHSICAYAINVGGGSSNVNIGCSSVPVLAGNPFGHLDAAIGNAGSVALWGWAIDPDIATPAAVHVYVDGVFSRALAANLARPDVARAFPAYGAAHGYATQIPLTHGTHRVCTYALNVRAGTTNTPLGCLAVKT